MTDAALELHQTRDFTREEQAALNKRFEALMWPAAVRWRFRVLRYVYVGLLWIFAAACAIAIKRIDEVAPYAALTMFWSGLGAMTCVVLRRQMARHHRQQYPARPDFAAGDRHRLDETGLHHVRPGISFFCPLPGIKQMVDDGPYLVALLADNYGLLLAKAAFADQDVEGFCVELKRRWQAALGQPA